MPTAKRLPSGSWRCRVYVGLENGKRKYQSFTASTKKEAERLAAVAQIKKASPVSFGDAFADFYNSRVNVLSPNTLRSYRSFYDTHLCALATVPLSRLDALTLQRFINDRAAVLSPKSVANLWGIITSVLKQNGIQPPTIVLPQRQKNEIMIPSDNDVQMILSVCADDDLKTAVLLAAFCGLRRSEITALDNADPVTDTIRIDKAHAKTPGNKIVLKKPKSLAGFRTIKIPHDICVRVAAAIEKHGTAVPFHPDGITSRWEHLIRKNNLPPFRFHDLRHYCASTMIAQNIPDFYIIRYLGHQDDHMLKTVYGHIKKAQADQFANKMQDVVASFNF